MSDIGWQKLDPISKSKYTGYLDDIVSHMKNSKPYVDADLVTSAHECTHGLNSELRQKHNKSGHALNCLYVLKNNYCVIKEPPLTLNDVAKKVPQSLRDNTTYKMYMIDQQKYWNGEPLYILDELTAYTNGAFVGLQLNLLSRLKQSLTNSLDFLGYALVLLECVSTLTYDSTILQQFIYYSIQCNRTLYDRARVKGINCGKFYTILSSTNLVEFCVKIFGSEWCILNLGFIK